MDMSVRSGREMFVLIAHEEYLQENCIPKTVSFSIGKTIAGEDQAW